jgi:hypothetical protein
VRFTESRRVFSEVLNSEGSGDSAIAGEVNDLIGKRFFGGHIQHGRTLFGNSKILFFKILSVSVRSVHPEPEGRESYFGLTYPRQARMADILVANHLRFPSLARRTLVRFLAAAIEAFLARAERSAGVIVSRLRLPPIFPPFRPISRMT